MKNLHNNNKPQTSRGSTIRRVHVFITGRVQGVFFRMETHKQASDLGLKGWVRNLYDRRVEAVFEGNNDAVGRMIDWCKKGPRLAHVEHIEIIEEDPSNSFEEFKIRY